MRFIPNTITATASAVPKNFKPSPRPRFLRHANNANDRLRVAVLGGGVTGLTTAYRLAEDPSTDVTLFEKSGRFGGWLSSERIEVDGGSVLFEWGPRTLRAGSGSAQMSTAELVCFLLFLCWLFWRRHLLMELEIATRPGSSRQHPTNKQQLSGLL